MLDTFDPTNEMLLASVQELTTKLYALEKKFNEGGGGGSSDIPEPTIADAGKVLGVDDEGEYALVEGGENDKAILTVNDQLMGLICTNPTSDIWHIYRETSAPTGGTVTIGINLISGGATTFYNQDVSILELGDLLYYLDEQGHQVPYSGIKNFVTIEYLVTIEGDAVDNAFGKIVSETTENFGLLIDLDTGHIIYVGGID